MNTHTAQSHTPCEDCGVIVPQCATSTPHLYLRVSYCPSCLQTHDRYNLIVATASTLRDITIVRSQADWLAAARMADALAGQFRTLAAETPR